MPARFATQFRRFRETSGALVVLTGAGVSADSGIPTFRGKEGYWTVGSREYRPQEIATAAMFRRDPELVWSFYLYRMDVCRRARPNQGHQEIVAWETVLGDRFRLITQNVDGLHLEAGNRLERTYQIHGNLRELRCWQACGHPRWPLDVTRLGDARRRDQALSAADRQWLRCPSCHGWARPHVLWFDECYDEEQFYFDSSLRAAANADLLLVIGTSGATNLPMQVASLAAQKGCPVVEVNPDSSAFSAMADRTGGGWINGGASTVLPQLTPHLIGQRLPG